MIQRPKTKKQLLLRIGIAIAIIAAVVSQYNTLFFAVATTPINFVLK